MLIISIFIVLFVIFIYFLFDNFGKLPTIEEQEKYKKLDYYKNGCFINYKKTFNHLKKIDNKKFNIFIDFLLKTKSLPKNKLPNIKPIFNKVPEDFAIYWLGHSNTILELDKKRIIIDPIFENPSPVPFVIKQYQKPPINKNELPITDYIIITHNHYDHLEKNTIKLIKNGKFIVPLGVGAILRGWGIENNRIIELGWNEKFEENDLIIRALPTIHFSGRSFCDENKTLWAGFVIKSKNKNIFWSGDTGFDEDLLNIYKKYAPFDIVAIEIDAWNDAWADIHTFPNDAVKIAKQLQADYLLPIHWGMYNLAFHNWKESIELVVNEANKKNVKVLTPVFGEKVCKDNLPQKYWWKEYE